MLIHHFKKQPEIKNEDACPRLFIAGMSLAIIMGSAIPTYKLIVGPGFIMP